MRKIKKLNFKKIQQALRLSFHIYVIIIVVNFIVAAAIIRWLILASIPCIPRDQVASDSRCLYIFNNKVFEKGTRNNPHKGHPCGMDVTAIIPAFHVAEVTRYLDPNFRGDICTSNPSPQPSPQPTPFPSASPLPTPQQSPSPSAIILPTIRPSASPNQSQPSPHASPSSNTQLPIVSPSPNNTNTQPSATPGTGGFSTNNHSSPSPAANNNSNSSSAKSSPSPGSLALNNVPSPTSQKNIQVATEQNNNEKIVVPPDQSQNRINNNLTETSIPMDATQPSAEIDPWNDFLINSTKWFTYIMALFVVVSIVAGIILSLKSKK